MREQVIVNETKRTVVVVLQNRERDAIDRIQKALRQVDPNRNFMFRGTTSWLQGPRTLGTFVGIAKCHPDDTFTEAEGVALARSRAQRQYQRAMNREVIAVMELLTDLENELQDMIDYSVFNEGELQEYE